MNALLLLLLVLVVLGLVIPKTRQWITEEFRALSDWFLISLLRLTSQFESELTRDGKEEQKLWRERRLRDLRGLGLRSEQKRKG